MDDHAKFNDEQFLIKSKMKIADILKKSQKNPLTIDLIAENWKFTYCQQIDSIEKSDNCILIKCDAKWNSTVSNLPLGTTASCRTEFDRVPVQFTSYNCQLKNINGEKFLQISFPMEIYYPQKRANFRILTPGARATVPINPTHGVAIRMIDVQNISQGGLGLLDKTGSFSPKPGDQFETVTINLPNTNTIICSFVVRYCKEINTFGSKTTKQTKIGCQFTFIAQEYSSRLSNYILKHQPYSGGWFKDD